jgi:hypothetical protein
MEIPAVSNTWIIVAVILIPLIFVIMLYNRLIALRQTRKAPAV